MNGIYTEEEIASLRERVKDYLTEQRYAHTLAVEAEAARLGEIYLPEKTPALRVSALLHDITKRCDFEKQLQYCREFGIIISNYEKSSPKIFHAITAAGLMKRDFPEYSDEDAVSGVRWHTTGRAGMTLFESIVYLADYIEETRTFPDCVEVREFFYSGLARGEDKMTVLYRTMVLSLDRMIESLLQEGAPIEIDTVGARNYYISLLSD